MQFEFLVHRANDTTVSKTVSLNGEDISASVAGFEVELVSTVNGCGTYVHRFVGSAIADAKKAFVQGEKVIFSV